MKSERWNDLLREPIKSALAAALPAYLKERRWFGGKARAIRSASIDEAIPIPIEGAPDGACLALVRVDYAAGPPETYILPLAASDATEARGGAVPLARTASGGREALLFDASGEPSFCRALLEAIASRRSFPGARGRLEAWPTAAFSGKAGGEDLDAAVLGAEQSNTSIRFGRRWILKLLRRFEGGTSPELEITRFLTGRSSPVAAPRLAGAIEYHGASEEPTTVAVLQSFVPNRGDAWTFTLEALAGFYARILSAGAPPPRASARKSFLTLAREGIPAEDARWIGSYLDSARLLGRRTAELHLALAGRTDDPAFAPEPFGAADAKALGKGMLALAARALGELEERAPALSDPARAEARAVLAARPAIEERFKAIARRKAGGLKARCHGDYHLGQVLVADADFLIIDYEGEPARPLADRRRKRSPLVDVAGMLRSFHYAARGALLGQGSVPSPLGPPEGTLAPPIGPGDAARLEPWARLWYLGAGTAFLEAYFREARRGDFLPEKPADLEALLDGHLLEKAVYEVDYELNNRPTWLRIPLLGILELVAAG